MNGVFVRFLIELAAVFLVCWRFKIQFFTSSDVFWV